MTAKITITDLPSAINELERYDRQVRIWGEEGQQKLSKANITIIGTSQLAKYTALPLTALGIGNVRILGAEKTKENEHLLDIPLEKLNPNVNILSLPIDLETRTATIFLENSNAIIDTTNNPKSKTIVLEYAKKHKIPVITASVSQSNAKVMLWTPNIEQKYEHTMPNFQDKQQNPLIALLFGGIIAEEIKKIILGEQTLLTKDVYYKQGNKEKFTSLKQQDTKPLFNKEKYENARVCVLGCGALGNIAMLALAYMGFRCVDYYDFDTIESHNLNRQVCFSDAVGQNKAETLANKHNIINQKAKARGFNHKFELKKGIFSIDTIMTEGYDIGLDLVDNLYTRALFSAYAVTKSMPLITAASSPTDCDVATYVPGITACFNHLYPGYYQKAVQQEIIRRNSCIQEPNPSVIMTNQIAASLAALELCAVFDQENYGQPFNGALKYSSQLDNRLGQNPTRDVCNCHETKNIPELEIK